MHLGYFSRSWQMFTTSWKITRENTSLLKLAATGLAFSAVVFLLGGLAVLVAGMLTASAQPLSGGWWERPPTAVLVLIGAVVSMAASIVSTFFQGAIVYGTYQWLNGQQPTYQDSITGAKGRFAQLSQWAIVAVIITWVLSMVQHLLERIRFVGWILSGLVDIAWDTFRFLVVPIVMVEGLGPVDAMRRSKNLLKETWGDSLAAQFGVGIVGLVLAIPGILVALLSISVLPTPFNVIGGVIGACLILLAMMFASALTGVWQTVLYHYATKGSMPALVSGEQVQNAFLPKTTRRFGV